MPQLSMSSGDGEPDGVHSCQDLQRLTNSRLQILWELYSIPRTRFGSIARNLILEGCNVRPHMMFWEVRAILLFTYRVSDEDVATHIQNFHKLSVQRGAVV